MKRSERHHLKENAFAVAMAGLQGQVVQWGRGLMFGAAIGLGVLVLFAGYSWWSSRTAAQAGALLADALVLADAPVVPAPADEPVDFVQPPGSYPTIAAKMSAALPKLVEAADAYPGTEPGITARYRAAAALAALGRHDEAADQYRQVVDRDEGGVYGRMAILGLADVQIASGAYDEAIGLLVQLSGPDAETDLPVDGVLMRLGQAYGLAGRSGEAQAIFQRVVDEFPASLYFADADRELQALRTDG